jgi:hypothetical protein
MPSRWIFVTSLDSGFIYFRAREGYLVKRGAQELPASLDNGNPVAKRVYAKPRASCVLLGGGRVTESRRSSDVCVSRPISNRRCVMLTLSS